MNTRIPKVILHIVSLILAIGAGVLSIAETITPILAISPKLAMYWPAILAGAYSLDKFGSAILTAYAKFATLLEPTIEVNATNATVITDAGAGQKAMEGQGPGGGAKTLLSVILIASLALCGCSGTGFRASVSSIGIASGSSYDPRTGITTGSVSGVVTFRDPSDGKIIRLPVLYDGNKVIVPQPL